MAKIADIHISNLSYINNIMIQANRSPTIHLTVLKC